LTARPSDCAGGNWEGQKTTFGSESEDEEAGGAGQPAGTGDGGGTASGGGKREKDKKGKGKEGKAKGGSEEVRTVKRRKEGGGGGGSSKPEGGRGGGGAEGQSAEQQAVAPAKVKWVKLAVAELERAPKRRMRWRALWAALWERERVSGLGVSAKEAKAAAWAKISVSSKFEVDGHKLRLMVAS
jgi:hypothetical protein